MPRSPASLLVVSVIIACGACGPPRARRPEPAASVVAQLAAELDPGAPASAFWPAVPAELRRDFEVTAPADAAARLDAARARLGTWALELDADAAAITARFRAALEGIYLAEPLAWASPPGADGRAAAGLLYRLYAALDQPRYAEWIRSAANVGVDRKLHELLAATAPGMRAHLGAAILRAGAPADAVAAILKDHAARVSKAGDAARARALYVEFIARRGDEATAEDWFAVLDAQVRVDDRAAAGAAFERASALAAKTPGDRRIAAALREYGRDLKRLDRYLALAGQTTLEVRLERVDLLRRIGRATEARAMVKELRAEHPRDARVRVRVAALAFEDLHSQPLAAATRVADELSDEALLHKDGDYWALLIGAEGMHLMGEILPELGRDVAAGTDKMFAVLKTLRKRADELAKQKPGRAAVLAFVLDRLIPLSDRIKAGDSAAIVEVLKTGLADAVALRARHPETIDADRLVFTLATFTPDRAAALAAVAARPKTPPDDDPELYLARTRTAMPLALLVGTPAAADTARTLTGEIAPSWDPKLEAAREALLGDCDAIDAIVKRDAAALGRAAVHYEAARKLHKEGRPRATNNLGWIALQGGDAARADELFREAAAEASDRRWVPLLNALASPLRAGERLDGVRALVASARAEGKPPVALLTHLAVLSPEAKEATDAAAEALTQLDDPFTAVKPDAGKLGIETEGFFQVGLGIASIRLYELNTQAYASLWMMPPLPLDRAQLQAKARPPEPAVPPATPPAKKPKKK